MIYTVTQGGTYKFVESNVKEGWITGILTRLIAEGKESGITLGVAFPANENLSHFHDVYVFNNTPVECFGFYEDMSRLEQCRSSHRASQDRKMPCRWGSG